MMYPTININVNNVFVSRFAPKPMTHVELSDKVYGLPPKLMMELGAKLYLLMNLTWGYVETVICLCKDLRLVETKKDAREIRELKRSYDQFRSNTMGDLETAQETEMGEWFEEIFSHDFDKLFASIDMEATKLSKSSADKMLIVAVHQCLTLIEAVKMFAIYGDERIKEHGAWTCKYCMVQTEFLKMHEVMKNYPTGRDERFSALRNISAKILTNRLHQLDVGTENGRIWLKANKKSNQ